MKILAEDLQTGQVLRTEYGDYDNWISVTVNEVYVSEYQIIVICGNEHIDTELNFKPNEQVEVINHE